ncbi:MAG TPA: hypothetical protein VN683_12975 [Acidothermaceae bacterium]|nr:hypothetical protein [Acidothermaceae bacterium]
MKADVAAPGARDRSRWASPRFAETLFIVALLLLIAGIPLSVAAHQFEAGVREVLLMLPFALVGVVVARRRPDNPIGWLMLLIAPISTLGADGGLYGVVAFRMGHPDLPLARLGVALTICWIAVLLLLPLPILLFPDGALPSPRWRWTVWAYAADSLVLLLALAVKDAAAFTDKVVKVGSFGELQSLSGNAKGTSAAIISLTFFIYAVLALSWVIGRLLSYRHSTGTHRQQLKWLISGGIVGVAGAVVGLVWSNSAAVGLRVLADASSFALIAVPVSLGVGILRYRLYDIDRLISRTLSYALVTALLVGVYVGMVTLATRALPLSSPIGVAASTLTVAALFTPLRRRAQRIVDRRFNRAGYDADATIAAFAARLRDEVDLERVQRDLLDVVRSAVEPAHATIWIRSHA